MTREERKEYMREYYKKNREKMLNASKEYYDNVKDSEEFKEKRDERNKKAYYKDVEKSREISRNNYKRYYSENQEKELERARNNRKNKRMKGAK